MLRQRQTLIGFARKNLSWCLFFELKRSVESPANNVRLNLITNWTSNSELFFFPLLLPRKWIINESAGSDGVRDSQRLLVLQYFPYQKVWEHFWQFDMASAPKHRQYIFRHVRNLLSRRCTILLSNIKIYYFLKLKCLLPPRKFVTRAQAQKCKKMSYLSIDRY